MEDWKPDKKIAGGALGIGVPASLVIAWALTELAGVDVPAPVAAAFGSLISALAGYLLPK